MAFKEYHDTPSIRAKCECDIPGRGVGGVYFQAIVHELRPVQLSLVWCVCLVVRARCRLGAADIAYDLRWDFRALGNGSLSRPYTDVRATIARQHSSCRLSTLLLLQSLSMPFLWRAIRESSQKLSLMLKSHNGLTSKKAMWFFAAYISASRSCTCRLKARCNLFPTRTFGTPGACFSTSSSHLSILSKDHLFVMSYTSRIPWAPREYDRIIVQNLPCPEVSHSWSLTLFPSKSIVVVLYPLPLQKGESAEPSSKSWRISCFPTSESPTSSTFKR